MLDGFDVKMSPSDKSGVLNTANKTSSCAVTPNSAARSEPGLPTWAAWTRLKSVVPAVLSGPKHMKNIVLGGEYTSFQNRYLK